MRIRSRRSLVLVGLCGLVVIGVLLRMLAPPAPADFARRTPAHQPAQAAARTARAEEYGAPATAAEPERTPLAPFATSEEPGPAFTGIVTDPDGVGIEGAILGIHPARIEEGVEPVPLAFGVSDAAGRFAIPFAEASEETPLRIEAEAEGYRGVSLDPISPDREITLKLRWSTELFGRVLDADTGRPLAGARVSTWPRVATSDGSGEYRLPSLAVGQCVQLTAYLEGYARFEQAVDLDSREPIERAIQLQRGVPLRLHVFDADTERALVGASVLCGSDRLGETDTAGDFVVPVVEGSELDLRFELEGYADFSWSLDVKSTDALGAPRIPMRAFGWIDGVVRDEQGEPLAGCWFYAWKESHPFGHQVTDSKLRLDHDLPGSSSYAIDHDDLEARSDAQGEFTIAVLPGEDPFEVVGGSPEYVRARRKPVYVLAAGTRTRVDFVLRVGATLRGRVLYNGESWQKGKVYFEHESGVLGGYVRPDKKGRYLIANVPPGRVGLKLRANAAGSPLPDPAELVVEAGKGYRHDFLWSEELATIRGVVVEGDGRRVTSIPVSATLSGPDGGGRQFQAKTGADGSFSIQVAPQATYALRAYRRPGEARREDVPAGAEGVELVLPEVRWVRVRLVDAASGETIMPGVRFGNRLRGASWREHGTDAFRTVHRPEVVDGVVELSVAVEEQTAVDLSFHFSREGYRPERVLGVPTSPTGAEAFVAEVELRRGFACKLKLVGDEPPALDSLQDHLLFLVCEDQLSLLRGPYPKQGGPSNARINGICMWVGEPGLLDQLVYFDELGWAGVEGLKPGRYTLKAFPEDLVFEPNEFVLTEDANTVELRLRSY